MPGSVRARTCLAMDPAQAPPDPLIGTVVAGRYKVIELLGEGGMGQVYLAEHIAIERRIALKVLRAEYAHKGDIVTRFQQEAISASRIKHPNVLDVFDFGQLEDGCFYLAMEFLEGNDLAEELGHRHVLEPALGVGISLQICRALGAAHSKGVVHRDMKPENVFLQRTGDGDERVKIVDFGIALLRSNEEAAESKRRRLTRTGMIFGTPEYMAPEQAAGRRADHRADVYAVGIMMYEMFTGAVPFTDETFLGVLAKHASDQPPKMTEIAPELKISPQLQAVIMQALVKNPDERYASMADFMQAILATPEGQIHQRYGSGAMTDKSSFIPPAPGNPTAPEFGVVSGAPAAPPVDPNRGKATRAAGSVERADTMLSSESMPAPGHHPGPLSGMGAAVGVALIAVLGVGGVGAAFFFRHRAEPAAEPSAEPPPSVQAAEAPTPAPSPVDPPPSVSAAGAPPPLHGVRLDVVTEPAGATLAKNGFQVCDETPCEVLASPGETLELEAIKDKLRGSAKVLAQRDQKVEIRLSPPRPVAKPKPKPRMCEVEVDGLKILRPCP